jgi:hypothetical protein
MCALVAAIRNSLKVSRPTRFAQSAIDETPHEIDSVVRFKTDKIRIVRHSMMEDPRMLKILSRELVECVEKGFYDAADPGASHAKEALHVRSKRTRFGQTEDQHKKTRLKRRRILSVDFDGILGTLEKSTYFGPQCIGHGLELIGSKAKVCVAGTSTREKVSNQQWRSVVVDIQILVLVVNVTTKFIDFIDGLVCGIVLVLVH